MIAKGFLAFYAVAMLASPLQAQVDYNRAERLLSWNTSKMIAGDEVDPEWMQDESRFWYRNKMGAGYEFLIVDPELGTQVPLFDHYRLAASLSLVSDSSFNPDKLPFETFEFLREETAIEFNANKKRFECDLGSYTCTIGDTLPDQRGFVKSPDKQWEAFIHEHNLFVRPTGGGDSIQLTTDGEEFWGYGLTYPRPNDIKNKRVRRPSLRWSPDSRRIAVSRNDQRNVEHLHYVSYTSQRPKHYSQPYALPGDSIIPVPAFHIVDAGQRIDIITEEGSPGGPAEGDDGAVGLQGTQNIRVEVSPTPHQLSINGSGPDSAWSGDGEKFYTTYFTRGSKAVYLAEVDANTGEQRVILGDSSRTFVELSQRGPPSWHTTEDGNDIIWWSERDGWAHLYRFDGDGNLKNQITSGPWTVGTVHHVDETARQIYFTGRAKETDEFTYYAHLYRVNFDGSDLQLLTAEPGNHEISFAPNGRSFVDRYSTMGGAPVIVLRAPPDGRVIRTLQEADISRLEEIGWRPAEVFTVKARDGVTDIYGVVYFPPDVDSTKKYPIVDHIYPGPQVGSVGNWRFKGGGEDFALAQLGFVVIQLDHLGTPHRSKAFHDNYYGNFTDNGLPDHVAAIKQLAARYPFIDLDRVGIYGHSGGGFASTDAILRFPEFYKVAVSGAGNHDNRSYNIYWAEKYQGLLERDSLAKTDNFEDSANKTYVENLEGKLLLMHGDMDDNVHPAMTVQLVNELIKANKDFDLIWAPDRAHSLNEPYFIRRRWDYFVTHLLGQEPPREYKIVKPEN